MPTPSVDESELLIRQISPGGNPIYFDPARKPPVHQQAFLPSRKDADGLSLIRGRFRSDIWSAYRPEQPAVRFRLVHAQVSSLDQVADECGIQEFSYQSTPDALDNQHGTPWGHCVATKINRTVYDSDDAAKRRIKEWALGVANLFTEQDVVGPFDAPRQGDEYRPVNNPE